MLSEKQTKEKKTLISFVISVSKFIPVRKKLLYILNWKLTAIAEFSQVGVLIQNTFGLISVNIDAWDICDIHYKLIGK